MDGSCFLGPIMKLLLGIFLLTFIHTISPCLAITNITTDQSALLALKAHITDDPHNILASNWSTSTSVCNWVGVTCGLRHHRVTVLNFASFGLTGTIPPHLGNLSFLTVLIFKNNSFHGSLPIELTHLRRLKLINFGRNKFVGEIPLLFGSFSKLQRLYLYYNQFSGSIPTAIFNSSSCLEELFLYQNLLSGSIPKEIGNATILNTLYVDENKLTGSIPKEIGNVAMLNTLHVHENNLKGTIPSVLFNMSYLKILWLGDNNFDSSHLSDKICQNLPNLEDLYMANSNLSGLIPSQLSQCGKLHFLTLAFNNFVGSIPRTVGNMTNLEVLELQNNKLTAKFLTGSDLITQTMTLATVGYMAPEYGLEGFVSTRGDMYSYGILLMETFTRKKPIDEMFVGELSLKKWVEDAFTHYDVMDVVDTRLLEGENVLVLKELVSSVFKLALCCTAELPIERKNMKEISTELNKVKSKYLLEI